jgi:hypothetical protein
LRTHARPDATKAKSLVHPSDAFVLGYECDELYPMRKCIFTQLMYNIRPEALMTVGWQGSYPDDLGYLTDRVV